MAVNYGLLQNIQPPSVVGQLPGSQQSSGDSLASGIMGGLQQGMNIRSMKQNMDQNAALFPSQLLRSQQAAESEGIDLQDKKQAQQDRKTLRAASAESEEKYLSALAKLNPAEAQDYLLKKTQTAKATAEVAGILEDNKGKGLDNYAKAITQQGQIAGAALAGADAEMKQRLYSYGRSNAPKAIQDIMPEKFDQKWAVGAIKLAEENMADYLEKENKKTDAVITLEQLQTKRDNLENNINQAKAQGKDTSIMERNFNETSQLIDTKIKNTQTTKQDAYSAKLEEELGKKDAERVMVAEDSMSKMDTYLDVSNRQLEQLGNVPDIALGPIQSATGLYSLSGDAQAFQSIVSQTTLLAKDILGLKGGTQGFTEGERRFVEQAAGTTSQYKGTLPQIIQGMQYMAKKVKYRDWVEANSKRKGMANYQDWLEAHPKPENPGETPEFIRKMNEDKAAEQRANTKTIDGVTYEQRDGNWYTK